MLHRSADLRPVDETGARSTAARSTNKRSNRPRAVPAFHERNILLVVHEPAEVVNTTYEHARTLKEGLHGNVVKVDSASGRYLDLSGFDVIIFHYSLVISSKRYIHAAFRHKIREFKGLKIAFIQDEYRWIDRTANSLRDLGVDVVFSLVDKEDVRKVYRHPWCESIRFEHTLTGFTPVELARKRVPDYEDRPLDVVYRARRLPAWYGKHAQQKWRIAEDFIPHAKAFGLKFDISTLEQDRIYGASWDTFIANSKSALGTESGVSVCDFSGELQKSVEDHVRKHPDTTFEELHDLYIGEADGKIVINVLSPRCFEAAALRTLMILYPGDYSGVLEAGRHYVMLEPDQSNVEDVIDVLRHPTKAKEIIDTAFREIAMSERWSPAALAAHVNAVIHEEAGPPIGALPPLPDDIEKAQEKARAQTRRQQKIHEFLLALSNLVPKTHDTLQAHLPEAVWKIVKPPLRFVYRQARAVVRKMFEIRNRRS